MSDVKSFNKSAPAKRRKGTRVPRSLPLNEMLIRTSWNENALQSSAPGVIAATFSPSLSYALESSVLQSLFTEVKLVSYQVRFFPIQAGGSSTTNAVNSYVTLGTNMVMNGTTFTNPASVGDVINLAHRIDMSSTNPRPTYYNMVVPSKLEYLSTATAADIPTVPNPYAGSPGAVVVYGGNFGTSIPYWRCDSMTIFHLRGRA